MRIYLDTNVFITAVERSGPASELVQKLMSTGERNPGLLVTSELTLAELLVKPFQSESAGGPISARAHASTHSLVLLYSSMIVGRPRLGVVPVDRSILIRSAFRRAENTAIKLPDAIHLATASTRDVRISSAAIASSCPLLSSSSTMSISAWSLWMRF